MPEFSGVVASKAVPPLSDVYHFTVLLLDGVVSRSAIVLDPQIETEFSLIFFTVTANRYADSQTPVVWLA